MINIRSRQKGAIFIIAIVGMFTFIASIFLFFFFFKFHVTVIVTEVYDFYRYQDVPMVLYSLNLPEDCDSGSCRTPLALALSKAMIDDNSREEFIANFEDRASTILPSKCYKLVIYDVDSNEEVVKLEKTGGCDMSHSYPFSYYIPLAYDGEVRMAKLEFTYYGGGQG